ncbi:MAG: triose-phosphate isomerase [Acidobacteria bacterium]|nr:triose-phosphate isomerase [Acidobacteriota bacterium]
MSPSAGRPASTGRSASAGGAGESGGPSGNGRGAAGAPGAGSERPAGRRRRIVAGNWKMHLLAAEAVGFCRELLRGLERPAPEVILFPSFPLLPPVVQELAGSEVTVGAQDLHPADRGAHTGDVSGPQLRDAGCSWVLCGHSERRRDHAETDELVARKVAAAARHGLAPLLCVGETREQRDAGETLAVLERQATVGLSLLSPLTSGGGGWPGGLVLAYEPVWAIGTGLTASPETAQEAHNFLRAAVTRLTGERPEALTLLYGGSVTAANASSLIAQPDVDGFLVGGASLDPQQFLAIIAGSG